LVFEFWELQKRVFILKSLSCTDTVSLHNDIQLIFEHVRILSVYEYAMISLHRDFLILILNKILLQCPKLKKNIEK